MDMSEIVGAISDGLFGGLSQVVELGNAVWNFLISLSCGTLLTTPQTFSEAAWTYTTVIVMGVTTAVGASLLNFMYLLGLARMTSNIREGITLEMVIDSLIKLVCGNLMMLHGIQIITLIFEIAQLLTGAFCVTIPPVSLDADLGTAFFSYMFGLLYFIIALVCGATVFLTIYGRFLQLYVLVGVGPIAWSTIAGGRGISSTAIAWFKTFLSKTFEIVIIALFMAIGNIFCNVIDFMGGTGLDGFTQHLQNMATMIILAASVKGADVFMRRTFGF